MSESFQRRVVFLDIDGTILDHHGTVAPSTVEAIRAARSRGHLVYVSTGRSAGDIHPDVRAIDFDGAITNGGAYARSGEQTILARPMPAPAVERLIAWFSSNGVPFFLQTDHGVFGSELMRAGVAEYLHRTRGSSAPPASEPVVPRFADLREANLGEIAKAVFISSAADTLHRAQRELGDEFHVVPGSMPLPGGSNGEISMRGTTKGAAIVTVMAHLGLSPEVAIGVGDSWNDEEMFSVCGLSIAMGNAEEGIKVLADEVTGSVLRDGVWQALDRHGLL